MIRFIAPYTFTQIGTTDNTALSLFYTLSIQRYTRTKVLSSLVVSWQRIYHSLTGTSHSKCHCTMAHMKSSLHNLFSSLYYSSAANSEDSTQLSSSYSYSLAFRNSALRFRLLFSTLLYCRTRLITTLTGLRRKHSLCCQRGVFTVPLPSTRLPIVSRVGFRKNVFTQSLPSNGLHVTISRGRSQNRKFGE
jgi:hypothetical protein